MASRSKIMKRGAESNGKASRSCCAIHAAVGFAVTAQRTTSRRSSPGGPWPRAMVDDEEHVKDVEHRCGHREEVHGRDPVSVVSEKGGPGGVGPRGARQGVQVSRDAAL